MQINIIAAVARNNAIGYQNKLIYWLPNDLKRFKALTTGHTIIMGRNTFLSLPKGALPNRRNVVLSTTQTVFPGCECFSSLHDALQSCSTDEDIYIIGGAKLYNEAITIAHKLLLTEVDDTPDKADAFFPCYDGWAEKDRQCHKKDEKHDFNYCFVDYERPATPSLD
jgi:dihydrofolate reductase